MDSERIHKSGRNTEERFIKVREGSAGQSLLETAASSLCLVSSFIFSNQDVNCFCLQLEVGEGVVKLVITIFAYVM